MAKAPTGRFHRPKKSEKPGANKRCETDLAKDRAEISELYLSGKTMRQIAVIISAKRPYTLSRNAIMQDIKAVRADWRERAVMNIGEHIEEQLAKIDRAESEAWDAWERSKQEAVTTRQEKGDSGHLKASKTTVGQCGDSTYLRVILSCVERRSKLLGLDAPDRTEITGAGGGPIKTEGGFDADFLKKRMREFYAGDADGG